ncbi:MAG: MBL fold metallo-hydrolase [Candidatus Cloacimonetes bacterium]|nr:MBL fold metallo-hydrolase [Candidatus Cloacimonadota bacterium]
MQIKVLGHSSLYIEFLDQKILVDPCLQSEIMGVYRRFPDLGDLDFQLPTADIIILTHHHWDVVCIETLLSFKKDIKILIPNNSQLISILKQLEFVNVEVLEPWQSINFIGGQLMSVPSHVSFGEMGFVLSTDTSTFLNLADCKVTNEIVQGINLRFETVDLCFAPFQSYDEMAVLKRENSKLSHQYLIEQATLISKIKSQVVLPFKDGIYYPNSDIMNKKSFLYSPFQFIKLMREINPNIQSDILISLDEITLLDSKVNIKRQDRFSSDELMALFNEYRFYDHNQNFGSGFQERVHSVEALIDVRKFLLEDFYRYLNAKMKKQCRLESVIFSIDIENCTTGFEVDFSTSHVELKPITDLSSVCVFNILLEDLIDLIHGRQLLSILMQTDRVSVKGLSDQMKYRALDIMFAAGFADSYKLDSYLSYIQENPIISYGDISEDIY